MSESLGQQDTLLLVERLLEVSRKLESISYANWWSKPFWWAVKIMKPLEFIRLRKINELMACISDLVGELSVRYDGIMRDLFTCAGVSTSFDDHFVQVWMEVQGRSLMTRDPRRFSTCLWEIQRRVGATIEDLKPKFMLRQFVDDMPDAEPRATLKLLAYSFQAQWPAAGKEAVRMVKQGYASLHEQVRARTDDLEILTGGVLNAGMLGDMGDPYVRYHQWLFHEC